MERSATRLIGRAGALREARSALGAGARVLTLMGPPGVGKSTLLSALGLDVACDLFLVRSPDELAASVARALGLELGPRANPTNVGEVLRLREGLTLALDHAEALQPTGIRVLQDWIEGAGSLQIAVASRVSLGLSIERQQLVVPLAAADALALFLDRARRARPALAKAAKDRRRLGTIVSKLEGIPLAIELAAARMTVLSIEGLEEGLRDRFALLRTPRPSPIHHHGSLWNAIELSWDLLADREREMLKALTTFRGGFDAKAVQAVANEASPVEVLDGLQALRDHSLIVARPARDAIRFDLLDSIREFADSHLSDEARRSLQDRHAHYYVESAESTLPTMWGPDRDVSIRWFSDERMNLLAAEQRYRTLGPELSARAALMVYESISRQGPLSLCEQMVQAALGSSERTTDRWLTARAWGARGIHSWLGGNAVEAERSLSRAIDLADGNRSATVADWEYWRAAAQYLSMNSETASRGFGRALELAGETGAIHVQAAVVAALTWLATDQGDYTRARTLAVEAERLGSEIDDVMVLSHALRCRAAVELCLGDTEGARQVLRKGERAAARSGSKYASASIERDYGFVALYEGRLAEARRHLRRARGLHAESIPGLAEGSLVGGLGLLDAFEGRVVEARDAVEEALRLLQREGRKRNELFYAACLAAIDASLGRVAAAHERVEWIVRSTPESEPTLRSAVEAVAAFVAVAWAADAYARGQLARADRAQEASSAWWRSRESLRKAGFTAGLAQRLLDVLTPRVVVGPPWQDPAGERPVPVGLCVEVQSPAEASPWPNALRVAQDGSRFVLQGGRLVDLSSREALRGLLAALVAERGRVPGGLVRRTKLVEQRGGSKGQVQTSILRLRELGLRDVIREHQGGYALDPALSVVCVLSWA